jgi:acetylglutamate kinase
LREYIEKAKVLVEALPYIKEFGGITVVIKYGGSALIDEGVRDTILDDIVLMKYVGLKPVVVHGGGKDINVMLDRFGIKSEFVGGLRVTDADAMEVIEMTLSGKLNKELASRLNRHGVAAVGISGKDASLLTTSRKRASDGVDLGFVGEIDAVNPGIIHALIERDFVPVISPVAASASGETHNVNADFAAVAIAGALKAEKLVFLTDVEGVRANAGDKGSVLSRATLGQIGRMIESGAISGGMIPKVMCCVAGVKAGVKNVHILDGRVEHSLILEIFTKEGIGTLIELEARGEKLERA